MMISWARVEALFHFGLPTPEHAKHRAASLSGNWFYSPKIKPRVGPSVTLSEASGAVGLVENVSFQLRWVNVGRGMISNVQLADLICL